jgi:lipoate-protein ligase A
MTAWRFLDSGALPGARNMAIDQAILRGHATGQSPPTLRLYQWNPPAVSLGYCQKRHNLNLAACRRLGFEVIRRPSGGRAVLHLGDLTYAVIAGTADGIPATVTAAYRLICGGLLQGLGLLGIEAVMGSSSLKAPPMDICFLGGTMGAILYQERKFVGSAQTWHASFMLQHGSIILVPQVEALVGLWQGRAASSEELQAGLAARVTSLQEILGRPPGIDEVKSAIRVGMARALGVRFDQGELTRGELALAKDLTNQEDENPCPTRTLPKFLSAGSGSALRA